jgi:hypothetical protein
VAPRKYYTMHSVYEVLEEGVVVVECHTESEAWETVEQLRLINPQRDYTVRETLRSEVKPGFGRDPDLH